MRWFFLLLLILNACYLTWNLQDAPVKAKDVDAAAQPHGGDGGLRLISETGRVSEAQQVDAGSDCVFVGGTADLQPLKALARRLQEASVPFAAYATTSALGKEHWLRLSQLDVASNGPSASVLKEFKDLKQEIILCEGIATPE